MEQPASSSKVTVEYFDPHGVYQLLSPGLLPRLPLQNLHWESHNRPIRSIDTLHIDLVPAASEGALEASGAASGLRPSSSIGTATSSNLNLSRVKSEESSKRVSDGFQNQNLGQVVGERPDSRAGSGAKPTTKERRHQIPGLRQTPYLKVFLLRCDDNETYKAEARREVREWIKEHTPPTQSSTKRTTQENHDAYEWLIIHVVVPNTAAATQPRTSGKSSEGGSSNPAEKAAARWRGGGSTTILEKLRADFNGSSKSTIDRIAQIRIGINDVPYDILPRVVPAIPGSYSETPQENENAWLDLISKLKERILASFDLRVGQYEEDIQERDNQRSLPGWNFCTFFVLKEGLAGGFESVGLVEDALVGYDELAVGLDSIVREQSVTGSGPQHGGDFLPFTEDLKELAERTKTAILRDNGEDDTEESIDLQSTPNTTDHELDEIPVDASRKRYRQLILSNNISIFDFRCYIFARQLSLLLRLANATSSQEELLAKLKEQREINMQGIASRSPAIKPTNDSENLVVLGEVCRRTLGFVASISRILRDDIWASQAKQTNPAEGADEKTPSEAHPIYDPVMEKVVDNIAASFTFGVAQQILAQTSTKALPIPPSTLAPPSSQIELGGQEPKASIPEPKTMMHPARSTSLAVRPVSRDPVAGGGNRSSSVPGTGNPAAFIKVGLEDLAGHRAELYLLSRSVLEHIGKERGWSTGWQEVAEAQGGNGVMEEVDLSKYAPKAKQASGQVPASLHGIRNRLLQTAADNQDDFTRLYEILTDKALRHYTVAGYKQSVLSAMADLAILKYHVKDYSAAASYFYRMTPSYGESGWSQVELSMLLLYANCLKELQRKDEFVRVVLKLLSKAALAEKATQLRKSTLKIGRPPNFESEEVLSATSYLKELLETTKTLPHEIRVPLENFFGRLDVDNTANYHPQQDSFTLQLKLRYLLEDDLPIEKAKVRINATFGETNREIWLETEGPTTFKKGDCFLTVQTNVIVPGTYIVGHVSLHVSNMIFEYEHVNAPVPSRVDSFFRCPKILLYHRSEAFDIKLFASKYMHLDRNRFLELELSSGWNDVISGELHIRAATAGMRLQTSEATVIEGSLELEDRVEAGVVKFGALSSYSTAKIRMPFNLEHESSDVSLKIEISYTTENGTFFFATLPTMSIMLPLGVNVQDVFKHKALFSKFTISSANSSPLRLLSSRLDGSEIFDSKCGLPISKPIIIFPRQPATVLYKILKKASTSTTSAKFGTKPKRSLSLVLHYVGLEEEIDSAITASLKTAFHDTPLQPYSRLLIPTVLKALQARLSHYDLERIAVLNEVSTSFLANTHWKDYLHGLGKTTEGEEDIATLLHRGLETWQQQTPSLSLLSSSPDDNFIAPTRSIVIPVDVPTVTVVHTADLKLSTPSAPTSSNTIIAASNTPIPATLEIKWTRRWDVQEDSESKKNNDLEFFFEVSGHSDTWLIGGKRKGHFKVPPNQPQAPEAKDRNEKLSFPLVLIPLREGHLPYPNVEIKPAPVAKIIKPGGGDHEDGLKGRQTITCETDYKNSAETIRVISDAWKTTVSLDASGPQGGAMLLESEKRGTLGGEVIG